MSNERADQNATLLLPEQFDTTHINRRSILRAGGIIAAATALWWPREAAAAPIAFAKGRELQLKNAHTGENFRGEYWYDGRYNSDAFRDIKKFMRDHRTGEIFPIDPRLIDVLFVLHHRLGKNTPFTLYSGYRSPKSNAQLREESSGVAKKSLHMLGQAADIGLEGMSTQSIAAQAKSLQAGGVGHYPASRFVHVDTGRVRSW